MCCALRNVIERLKKFEIVAKEGAFECGRRESVVIDEKLLVCVLYEGGEFEREVRKA